MFRILKTQLKAKATAFNARRAAVIFVAINYCLDALYCVLDPRIRLAP